MSLFALAGPLLSLGASSSARRAARRAQEIANQQAGVVENAYAPLKGLFDRSLPLMERQGYNLYGSKVGKKSDILEGERRLALSDIDKNEKRALAASSMFHGMSGNTGRGRGEALRIGASATDQKNRARLGFAGAQEDYMDRNAGNYMGFLGGMTNLGAQSIQGTVQAAGIRAGGAQTANQIRADANQGMWNSLAGTVGDMWGNSLAKKDRRWTEDMYRKMGLFDK